MPTLTEPQPTGEQAAPQPNQKPVDTLGGGAEQGAPIDLRTPDEIAAQKAKEAQRAAVAAQAGTTAPPEGGGFDVAKKPAAPANPSQANPFKLEATEQAEVAAQPEVASSEVPVGLTTEPAPATEQENNTNHVITPDAGAPQSGGQMVDTTPQPDQAPTDQPAATPATEQASTPEVPAEQPKKRKKFLGIF